MIKILYSPKSRKDLDRILDYIHDDLNNPIAAEKIVKGILNKISELKEYPQLGSVWYLENNINSGFRFLKYDNYIIFYQITKETILIVRILHRLQNYVKQLL
ncbi:type II toxin-antitoxin system RelE/ParE family toxin [Thomasclavelia spiroformis]|uniref:type II toxin-antitoxin system RelE/ParE family toxin n=1 Tax=Thomasclavelia spiroformis TaxID=29348 RepID=UPI0024B21BDB|nr:type II toxin-antitoxin system RelE/ParE family toxin [Thomasclavelia spiroformis]